MNFQWLIHYSFVRKYVIKCCFILDISACNYQKKKKERNNLKIDML